MYAFKRAYAGVGSRKCPPIARLLAKVVATRMLINGFTLRSGAATGMDQAFEEGHDEAAIYHVLEPNKEIWLPELGFEGSDSTLLPSPEAYLIAKRIHENWKSCNEFSRNAHARNCHQILGADLKSPVRAVFCYTENAELVGGTRTALKLAQELSIPIFNFGDMTQTMDDLDRFIEKVISDV